MTYPLVVDGSKYYFDWPSRRAAVECLEEVQREFIQAKIRMRKQQVLRAEAAEKKAGKGKRLAQRRQAVVSASKAPDHNQQLFKVVRWVPPLERRPPCRVSAATSAWAVSVADSDGRALLPTAGRPAAPPAQGR